MRRLTQAQMDTDQGRIYGRAPIPGARFERDGVYYDSRGYECQLPGMKKAEPVVEVEPEKEPTEAEIRMEQFQAYLNGVTEDSQKDELREWMEANIGTTYHPNIGLAKLKTKALEDFRTAVDKSIAEAA